MILKQVVERLRPVLEEYATELKHVEDKIRRTGTIDLTICKICSRREIEKVIKFEAESNRATASFLAWIQENDVRRLSSSGETLAFQSSKKKVEGVEGNIPLLEIGQALAASTEEVVYDYRISVPKMRTKFFAALLRTPFADLSPCDHIVSLSNDAHLALITKNPRDRYAEGIEKLWQESQSINHYLVCCKDCFGRIDSIGCEDSIRREAFTYVHNCPIQSVLFKNLLTKHNIGYVESTERNSLSEGRVMVSLPDLRTFVAGSLSYIESAIEALNPEILLVFGPKESLVNYLQFGVNIVLFDREAESDALTVFDKSTPVEKNEGKIIEAIVSKLDEYSSEVRGKEHDKLVEGFRRIGEELGYVANLRWRKKVPASMLSGSIGPGKCRLPSKWRRRHSGKKTLSRLGRPLPG